jgi:small subunit ribosomal protein S4e
MAIMGSRKHLKRYKAPKNWPIHPKEDVWTVKPAAGPHAIEDSLSLLVVIRDILGLADNSREAKELLTLGKC